MGDATSGAGTAFLSRTPKSSLVLVAFELLNLASFLFSFDHYIVCSWIYEARVAQ